MKNAQSANDKPAHDIEDLNRAVARELKRLQSKAPPQPVTNECLAAIWPAWSALPPEFDASERDAILTGRHLDFDDYRKHYNRLTERFKKLLPLDSAEYHETLKVASEWWRLMIASRSCIAANKHEIERQLRYESFDKKLIGFMASYRMHREFDATRPDLLTEDKCPTSEDLNFVRSRLEAYARGRRDAVEILSGLVFVKALLAGRDLPFEKQTVEHSQPRFPRHLFVARLKAFGKCSDRLLAHFMTQEFFQLSNEAMKDFCDEYKQPPVGREDYDHLRLWAWLAENAPAFNLCKAQWLQIFKEVKSRFRPGAPEGCRSHPPNEDSLKKQWHDFAKKHGLSKPPRITPPEGPRSKVTANLITDLLTPVPDFSTVN